MASRYQRNFWQKIWKNTKHIVSLQKEIEKLNKMEPKIGDKMKVSPQLTAQADWVDGEVIDVEHNPFLGLNSDAYFLVRVVSL